jgi:hypothetical protein
LFVCFVPFFLNSAGGAILRRIDEGVGGGLQKWREWNTVVAKEQ